MSADNLESIEENGDYWLSKSNTAYHIINPNATNLTTIEANGYYSLAKGGDTYYVLDGSGSSIRLYYDGVGRSMFGPHDSTGIYTPTNVEENPFDSGFLVLVYRNDKPEWNNSSFFNYNNFGFEFDTLGKYAGSDLKTVNNHAFPRPGIEYEPVFGLDLNDDDNIATGANPPNLLNISTIQHHIDDGHVNDGIILKRDSVTIDPNSYAGWSATQVIASVGEGYEVLWSHSSRYDVWKFDTSGNFVSSIKAKLWQDEEKFNLDLNGDGDTGLQPVEEIGGVHLKHGDNTYNGAPQYYIVDGSNAPIGLNVGGAPRGPTDGDWNVTQVVESGTGYEVFWSHNSGKFQVWKVDSSGSYETKVTAHLWQHENTFEVDLNGDGVQGLRTIETIGDVHLALGDNGYSGDTQYYIVDGSNAPIGLNVGGAPRGPTDGDWNVTQVEDSGTGYEVFWSHNSGKFQVWKVDSSGSYETKVTAHLWQHENTFEVDLNGDGVQGLRTIETIGDVHLALGDNGYSGDTQYYIVDGSNAPIGLSVRGAPRGPTDGDWNVTQVEDSGTGYEVFWSHNSGKFQVWKVDSSGSYETKVTAHLWQHENTFEVDPNGDGVQGLRTIETIGDVHLALGDNGYSGDTQYYIVDGSNAPIGLSVRGAPRGPTDGGWNVTQVEDSGTGYEVFWSHNSGKFQVWKVDSSGSYETKVTAHLWQHENTFEVDLNGDGIDSGNNDIYGSIGNDTFDGGAGDDIINGREGHDTLIGGEGNDWISGDGGSGYAGNDILFGNAGNDDLRGRGGNDQIDGGAGSDTITTGSGFDKIILRIGDGGNTLSDADIITDFTDGIDKLRLDGGLLFSQDMINQGTGAYASDTIISKGSEYLAILQGIDVSLLSDTDFETVDIA